MGVPRTKFGVSKILKFHNWTFLVCHGSLRYKNRLSEAIRQCFCIGFVRGKGKYCESDQPFLTARVITSKRFKNLDI